MVCHEIVASARGLTRLAQARQIAHRTREIGASTI
jgi:hypothetical protein